MQYSIIQLKEELEKRCKELEKHHWPHVALRQVDNTVHHGQLREVSTVAGSILIYCGQREDRVIAYENIKSFEFLVPDPRWAATAKAA